MMLNDINSEAYEEAQENAPVSKERPSKKSGNEIINLSFRLMIIIAAVVLMLAFVNGLTKNTIAENERRANDEARKSLFQDATAFTPVSANLSDDLAKYVGDIYEATNGSEKLGYCVSVSNNGFGGAINMIVGISYDGLISGVKVVSHSETAGVGERVISNGSILSLFVDLPTGSVSSLNPKDTITGATVTSNAIKKGVEKAVEAVTPIMNGGD